MALIPKQPPSAPSDSCDPEPRVPSLVDLVVFAPIGLAINAVDEYRKRAAVARFLGKMVVDQQKRKRLSPTIVVSSVVDPTLADEVPDPLEEPAVFPVVDDLPIDGYDTIPTRSILTLLEGLTPADLDRVEAYERGNRQRATILHRVAQLKTA